MEEKKAVATKVDNPKKMSYEQLEIIAHQLSEQNKQLYNKLQEVSISNAFKRLEFLFKVVENSNSFNKEFVDKCVTEIEDLITISDPDNTSEESE